MCRRGKVGFGGKVKGEVGFDGSLAGLVPLWSEMGANTLSREWPSVCLWLMLNQHYDQLHS